MRNPHRAVVCVCVCVCTKTKYTSPLFTLAKNTRRSPRMAVETRRKSTLTLFPIAEMEIEGAMRTPSTPDSSEPANAAYYMGRRLASPTMDPETRKSARSSPKVPQSRKAYLSPTNSSLAKRSGVKSSDFRGVSKCAKDGRWQSRIRVGKKVKYLGRFKTEEAAALRYDEAALALHGRRATLNFDLSEDELERALALVAEKRAEFGFDESDVNEDYSPRPSTSRTSSRSTSPSHSYDDDVVEEEDPTADDQHAAMGLMYLKLSSS